MVPRLLRLAPRFGFLSRLALRRWPLFRSQMPGESLEENRPAWERLALRRGTPMQQPGWAESFIASFAHVGALRLVTAGPRGQPTAVGTFVVRPGIAAPLEALAVREISEPWDVLAATAVAVCELAEKLARGERAVYVPRIPEDSVAVAALRAAYRKRGIVRMTQTDAYATLALDESWKAPESKFNSGRRSDFRRARRNAEKHGAVTFEILSPTVEELPALLEEAWTVEAAGWKGARGSSLTKDTHRGQFFRRYAFAAARTGILRMGFMRIGGRAVAMQLCTEADNRLWLSKIGYDEAFARCSPGQQLMMELVRWAAGRGHRAIEFLGEREPWTDLWTRQLTRCVSIRAYPFTTTGMARLALDTGEFALRKLEKGVRNLFPVSRS
ncbi:MAG: GNAT family N-acetyltransferase [Betaproteobacteria bacterium]